MSRATRSAAQSCSTAFGEFGQTHTRTPGEDEGEFECEVDGTSPSAGNPDLAADSEGLTIYRYGRARGYLLASSQGSSSFLVYDLQLAQAAEDLRDRRRHAPTLSTSSDGAMVVGVPLGPSAKGLLATHDGDDEPFDDATSFKLTRWVDIARPLEVDTVSATTRIRASNVMGPRRPGAMGGCEARTQERSSE